MKENSPNVRIFIGRVKIVTTGLTKVFSKPSTRATAKAVSKLSSTTPGNNFETTNTAMVFASRLRINFIF